MRRVSARKNDKATARVDLYELMVSQKLTRAAASAAAGIGRTSTVTAACQGKRIALSTAQAIATALNRDVKELFLVDVNSATLSNKTILEHHRLIRTVLSQAEKEMLVPYNAASKATPPKAEQKEVNYFQTQDVERIRDALEGAPLKWKVATHLLLLTGCRRGEIMGLKWSKIDFEKSQIKIDCALLYSAKRGIYEDTPKQTTSGL